MGLAPCKCCLHVRFLRLFWRLNQQDFVTFREYIAELKTERGFALNEVEPGYVLVMMKDQSMASLLNLAELNQLAGLLEQASLEQVRQQLQRQFETQPSEQI